MRVIAGQHKGRSILAPPPGDRRIRPTSDRAREALFSILQAWPQGAFLDLYGGTGAVALEASSRGYAPVTCVEKDPAAFALAERNAKGTAVRVLRRDALDLAPEAFQDLALVFADPPYEHSAQGFQRLAPRILHWIRPEGLLVWETDSSTELEAPMGWRAVDARDYGAARFHFFAPERK